jgi:predicted RecB family endonuclease
VIIVNEDMYAFDSAEFDALARDVGAQLITIASDARAVVHSGDRLQEAVRNALERRRP